MVAKYVLQELNTTPINNVKTKEKRFVTFFLHEINQQMSQNVDRCRQSLNSSSFTFNKYIMYF